MGRKLKERWPIIKKPQGFLWVFSLQNLQFASLTPRLIESGRATETILSSSLANKYSILATAFGLYKSSKRDILPCTEHQVFISTGGCYDKWHWQLPSQGPVRSPAALTSSGPPHYLPLPGHSCLVLGFYGWVGVGHEEMRWPQGQGAGIGPRPCQTHSLRAGLCRGRQSKGDGETGDILDPSIICL